MRPGSDSALLTDFYEIAMLQAYFQSGMNESATFEFFVRRLPAQRNFLVAAGLEQVVAHLRALRFSADDLAWLRESGRFDPAFIDSLEPMCFTGDVDALPEGTVFFADEPVVRVRAPLREAQLVESRVMNLLHFQTMVASKAVRIRLAAPRAQLIDFGMRRAHGAEAAVLSARAGYLAGFDGTATTIAAPLFDIPVFGTMAHSFVQVHAHETAAFASFARAFPDNVILLIDTYSTEAAAQQVVHLQRFLRQQGSSPIRAVRIDSGDLDAVARRVRHILDAGHCEDIAIFASSSLDEYALHALTVAHAPINGFGIGTRMNTSSDAPYLDCAYKLVDYAGRPCRKRSSGKQYWPGGKQVFRRYDAHGAMTSDTLAPQSASLPGRAMLEPLIRAGELVAPLPSLRTIRDRVGAEVAALPAALRSLTQAPPFPCLVAESLRELAHRVDAHQRAMAERDRAQWARV